MSHFDRLETAAEWVFTMGDEDEWAWRMRVYPDKYP